MAARIYPAATLDEARSAIRQGARPAAGMTVLALEWHAAPPRGDFVDLSRLPELRGIIEDANSVHIGAMTSLAECRDDPRLREALPALPALLDSVGSLGTRAQGTIGGNLGWGSGDLAPLLLAADAVTQGVEPGLIEAIRIPKDGMLVFAEKLGHRASVSPTLITVAFALRLEAGRIAALRLAVGGGPTRPQRLHSAEAALIGQDGAALDWREWGAGIATHIAAGQDALCDATHRARVAGRAIAYALWSHAASAVQLGQAA